MRNNSIFPAAVVFGLGLIASVSAYLLQVPMGHAQPQDPLFVQMQGHWSGKGTRTYPPSGRVTQVVTDVEATTSVVNGVERLTSTNNTTETAAGAQPTQYQNVYWIEADPAQAGHYKLSYSVTTGSTAQTVTTEGVYSTDHFSSIQSLGNDYSVDSETQFDAQGSTFTETTTNGSTIILKSVIQYTPASN